jgi:hypothetical protein
MITGRTTRSTCLLALALAGAVVATSVRMNAVSDEIAAAPATAGIDIAALSVADTPKLPLLVVNDPI